MQKNKKVNRKQFWKDSRFYFIFFLTVLMASLIIQLLMIPVLPFKYTLIIIIVLLIIWFLMWILQYNKKINKFNRRLGSTIIILLCLVLGVSNFYVFKGGETLNAISGAKIKTDAISVIVLKDSTVKELADLDGLDFGILDTIDRSNTDVALQNMQDQLQQQMKTSTYINTNDLAQALSDESVDSIVLNEAYRSVIEENDPNFSLNTKVIYQYEIHTELEDISKGVNVNKDSFNVFISGIDTYGSISATSRSDVNMLATINPSTHQILLTSIPRDYYIAQTCQGNQEDKLTHAGIFGVDCSISSLENFFGISINYYVRVNFSSLINIVDALGGVTVDNPNAFSGNLGTYFQPGEIYLNGTQALEFSRERYAFGDGDRERGKNQMRVITGIINKAISPSIITNYTSVMNAVSDSFETNMDSSEITKIIQKQLDTMSGWEIIQNAVSGNGSDNIWSPANGFNSYVMFPDMDTVNHTKDLIDQVMKGQTAN